MQIPQSAVLSTRALAGVFNNTTATYKYYWLIAILDLYCKRNQKTIGIRDIMIEMFALAWYSVCYFRLSLGKSDSLYNAILYIQKTYEVPINISGDKLRLWLRDNIADPDVASHLAFLKTNVPFRFLSPWIHEPDNSAMAERSMMLENGCLYKIDLSGEDMAIELNPAWLQYLNDNQCVLRDFAYWNLALFLQRRNPNVPGIPSKLIKPENREALSKQHAYWDYVISHSPCQHCIYTGKLLAAGVYDLDHFMPWAFVSHNLLWNLIPADGSINSGKGDRLPDLDRYLHKFADAQQTAVRTALANEGSQMRVLDDYLSLGITPGEFAQMEKCRLYDWHHKIFKPMQQLALNMGFEQWQG